jgi:hypothetical protein
MRQHFARHGGDYLTLAGSLHANFSDRPLLLPLRKWSGGGRIDPVRAQAIVRGVAAAFFDRWLRGEGSGVLPSPDLRIGFQGPTALGGFRAKP